MANALLITCNVHERGRSFSHKGKLWLCCFLFPESRHIDHPCLCGCVAFGPWRCRRLRLRRLKTAQRGLELLLLW